MGIMVILNEEKKLLEVGFLIFVSTLILTFLHTSRVLPSDIPIKIKLTRSNDAFSILSLNEDLTVKIHSLSLYVYRVQPSDKIRQLHNKLFAKKMRCFQ